ncbi:hypothetical protein BRADI_3g19535v3 [Brachypodium distachyon]|uniref:Uncharacterized protein n=1 Tax=Brachypodium distachyon TaxID=15368 RepID=A0A0Q3FCF7_BRADI|nr:hypothetical protein BRADI_3g19535v3 [Brachypodium distachyon]
MAGRCKCMVVLTYYPRARFEPQKTQSEQKHSCQLDTNSRCLYGQTSSWNVVKFADCQVQQHMKDLKFQPFQCRLSRADPCALLQSTSFAISFCNLSS